MSTGNFMWKLYSFVCGGLFVGLVGYALYVRPHVEPAAPDATKTLVLAMADHLFKETSFPVLVRRDNDLTDCAERGSGGGVLLLNREGQEAVTEFVYTSGLVCVQSYLSRQEAPKGQQPVDLKAGHYEARFGELHASNYFMERSIGFRFAATPEGGIATDAIEEFFQTIPRYFNARSEGGLSGMVGELKSPGTAAQTFARKMAPAPPKEGFALHFPGGWFTVLGLGLASLAIPALWRTWKHFRPAVPGQAPGGLPGIVTGEELDSPAPEPVVPEPGLSEQELYEREEKVIRMIALLKESIKEEAGPYAANLIFAKAEEAAKKGRHTGIAALSAERISLAGQLADLLENRHRRTPERTGQREEV